MKASELIRRLQEAIEHVGDVDVFVGEVSSIKRERIDVNAGIDWSVRDDEPVIVVQAYTLLT